MGCVEEKYGSASFDPDIWQPVVIRNPEDAQARLDTVAGDKYSFRELDDFTDLIKRGLMLRDQRTEDRRCYGLRISPSGLRLLNRAQRNTARARARLISPFTAPEQRALTLLLRRLVITLNDDARAPLDEAALPNTPRLAQRGTRKKSR